MEAVTRRSVLASGLSLLGMLAWPRRSDAAYTPRIHTRIEGDKSVDGRPGTSVVIVSTLRGAIGRTYVGLPGKRVRLYYRFYYVSNRYRRVYQEQAVTDQTGAVRFRVRTPGLPGRRFIFETAFEGDTNTAPSWRGIIVRSVA